MKSRANGEVEIPAYGDEIKECDDIFKNILRYIKKQSGYEVDYPLLEEAYETVKELHGNTRRHSGVLYLRHPLAVMESLSRLKCKTSILAAALLHDTMEDCNYPYESLRSSFKDEVAENVDRIIVLADAGVVMSGTPHEVFSRAEELVAVGLNVPQVTRVAMELRRRGVEIDPAVYTVADLRQALSALKGGKAPC